MERTSPDKNRKFLEALLSQSDTRNLVKRLFLTRVYSESEIRAALSEAGMEPEADPRSLVGAQLYIDSLDDPRFNWRRDPNYDHDSLEPPLEFRLLPGSFEIKPAGKGYIVSVNRAASYRQEERRGKRPSSQKIIKTKIAEEAEQLMDEGFSLVNTEVKKVPSRVIEGDWDSYVKPGYDLKIYVLAKQ